MLGISLLSMLWFWIIKNIFKYDQFNPQLTLVKLLDFYSSGIGTDKREVSFQTSVCNYKLSFKSTNLYLMQVYIKFSNKKFMSDTVVIFKDLHL